MDKVIGAAGLAFRTQRDILQLFLDVIPSHGTAKSADSSEAPAEKTKPAKDAKAKDPKANESKAADPIKPEEQKK